MVNKARNGRKLHNYKSKRLHASENWQIVEITYKTRNTGFSTPFLKRKHRHSSFKCPVNILFEANNSVYIYYSIHMIAGGHIGKNKWINVLFEIT